MPTYRKQTTAATAVAPVALGDAAFEHWLAEVRHWLATDPVFTAAKDAAIDTFVRALRDGMICWKVGDLVVHRELHRRVREFNRRDAKHPATYELEKARALASASLLLGELRSTVPRLARRLGVAFLARHLEPDDARRLMVWAVQRYLERTVIALAEEDLRTDAEDRLFRRRRRKSVKSEKAMLPKRVAWDIVAEELPTSAPDPLESLAGDERETALDELRQKRKHAILDRLRQRRERECLELLDQGLSRAEIAAEMGIARGTVDVYVHRIKKAAGVA